jgi:ADP-heptose:LPS heptosyltransferase
MSIVERVCILRRTGGVGDVLMLTPGLRALKETGVHVTFAIDLSTSTYSQLLAGCPFVDELIDSRRINHSSYDKVIDVSSVCIRQEHKGLPLVNRIDLFAKALGVEAKNKVPFYVVTAKEAEQARSLRTSNKMVVLHVASDDIKRSWPIERYVELITGTEKLSITYLILDWEGGRDWSSYSNCIDVSGTDIREMGALIGEADCFIGPDSGPMHMAGALATPSVVLFGSTPPDSRINYYPSHTGIVASTVSCLGCWYTKCEYVFKCMQDIQATEVCGQMIRTLRENA